MPGGSFEAPKDAGRIARDKKMLGRMLRCSGILGGCSKALKDVRGMTREKKRCWKDEEG